MVCYYTHTIYLFVSLCPGPFAVRTQTTLFFSRWNRPIVAGGTTWWCDVGWCLEILWTIATMAASWDDWIDSKSLGRLVGWEGGRNGYIYIHPPKKRSWIKKIGWTQKLSVDYDETGHMRLHPADVMSVENILACVKNSKVSSPDHDMSMDIHPSRKSWKTRWNQGIKTSTNKAQLISTWCASKRGEFGFCDSKLWEDWGTEMAGGLWVWRLFGGRG